MRVRPPTEPVAGQPRPALRAPRDPGRNWIDRVVQTVMVVLVGTAILTAAGTRQPAQTGTVTHATTHLTTRHP